MASCKLHAATALAFLLAAPMFAQFAATTPVKEYIRLGPRILAVERAYSPSWFVTQQYIDMLARAVSSTELTNGINSLSTGTSQSAFGYSLFTGSEYQGREWFAAGAYRVVLARDPDYASWNANVPSMVSGSLSQTGLTGQLLSSSAGVAIYGSMTDTQFVQQMYLNAFNRTADSGGLSYWVSQVPGLGRAGVAAAFVNASEFASVYGNRQFVHLMYFCYLRRDPDSSGLNFWLGQLNSLSQQAVLGQFIISAEYQARFP